MSERELGDWLRFEAFHELLPDKLSDLQNALLCSIVVNIVQGRDSSVTPSDFFVIRELQPPPPDDGLSEVDRQMRNWRGG